MKLFATLALLLACQITTKAQQISGTVKDETGKSIDKATVSLLKAKDSSIVKLNATKSGSYTFETTASGKYLVMATNVGYAPAYSQAFDYNGTAVKLDAIILQKASTQLAGVVVTAKNHWLR